VEQVRLCVYCGHLNNLSGGSRCRNCWLSLGAARLLPRVEAEQIAREKKFRYLRVKIIRRSLLTITIVSLLLWLVIAKNDLSSVIWPPNPATTNLNASTGASSWSQFRNGTRNAGYVNDHAPQPNEVLWTFESLRALVASPAVVRDRVYLSTEDGRTIALNRLTGDLMWEYVTGFPSSSTPAVSDSLVLSITRPGLITALETETGNLVWELDLKEPVLASPIIADGTLYVGSSDSHVYAIDVVTGVPRWSFDAGDWVTSAIAYSEGDLIITSQDHIVRVIDDRTGRQRMMYDTGRGRPTPGGAAIQGDIAYLGSYGGRVWAINWREVTYPFERALLFWKTTFYIWGLSKEAPVQKGSVWSKNIGGDIPFAPAISGDTVYVTNAEGKVVALESVTGTEIWFQDLQTNITSPTTIAGDTVLIGTEFGKAYGLDIGTGRIKWTFETGGKITGSPIVSAGILFIASEDGKLYAISGD